MRYAFHWVLLATVVGSCVSSKAESTPTTASQQPAAPADVVPASQPAAVAVAGADPAPVAHPAPRGSSEPTPAVMGPMVHGTHAATLGQGLTPPPTAGESRIEVTGCAAAANETDAERFVATTRGLAPPPTVEAVRGGALVVHPLDHACCLKLAVTTRLEGNTAIVREALSGSPCRCRCGSTVRTAVALKPGTWKVAIEVDDSKGLRRVHEQELEVR